MIQHIREAWKAVVAFLAPGLLVIGERVVVTDGDLDGPTLRRALIFGAATAVVVWATRNARSSDPTTSTPGPGGQDGAGELRLILCVAAGVALGVVLVVLLRALGLHLSL